MNALAALFVRDVRLALRVGGGASVAVLFFLIVVTLAPFAVGPDLALLRRIARALSLAAPVAHDLAARTPWLAIGMRLATPAARSVGRRAGVRFRLLPVEHEHLPDLLHRMGPEPLADGLEPDVALFPRRRRGAHLDELVRRERAVDLGNHLVGEALVADEDDGVEAVRLRPQLAAAPG